MLYIYKLHVKYTYTICYRFIQKYYRPDSRNSMHLFQINYLIS